MPPRGQVKTFTLSHVLTALAIVITLSTLALGFAKEWGELNHRVEVLEEFNVWSHGVSRAPNQRERE